MLEAKEEAEDAAEALEAEADEMEGAALEEAAEAEEADEDETAAEEEPAAPMQLASLVGEGKMTVGAAQREKTCSIGRRDSVTRGRLTRVVGGTICIL